MPIIQAPFAPWGAEDWSASSARVREDAPGDERKIQVDGPGDELAYLIYERFGTLDPALVRQALNAELAALAELTALRADRDRLREAFDALTTRSAALEAEKAELLEKLNLYGVHLGYCTNNEDSPCTCGLAPGAP